jgi:creatinine amidohydrolase
MDGRVTVKWSELLPDEFHRRIGELPVVYLPVGLCEPHGHVAALGLDLIKAQAYCEEAARRFGGIVAPSQGYHIHECGFHAPWLEEVLGEENPLMAAIPPDLMARLFLYQLRAFANTGFGAVIAVSGHSGGSQEDLRRVGDAFEARTGVTVVVKSDPEWVEGLYQGDHAGRYELSQLMALRPDLVDLSRIARRHEPGSGGRMALGDDAADSDPEHGRAINEAIIAAIGRQVEELRPVLARWVPGPLISFAGAETIWREILAKGGDWKSAKPWPGQPAVSPDSRWKPEEHLPLTLS